MENSELAHAIVTFIIMFSIFIIGANYQDIKFLKKDLRKLEEELNKIRWQK